MGAVKDLSEQNSSVGSFAKLTDREIEFLKLTCTELSYKEIAEKMLLGVRTVEGYRDALCEKLGLKTRVGLCLYAIKNNIVQP